MGLDDFEEQGMTPREVVEQLDRYIIGQNLAKRAVAVAMRNRWRRRQIEGELRDEIMPKNIIMIGATGVGKTEIARRLARMARAPFLKVEASKFTEVGYVGRDVESIVRDLVEVSITMVEREAQRRVELRTREYAEDMLLGLLESRISLERGSLAQTQDPKKTFIVGSEGIVQEDTSPLDAHELLRRRLRQGEFDALYVEIEVNVSSSRRVPLDDTVSRVLESRGIKDDEIKGVFDGMFGAQNKRRRRIMVKDAMHVLMAQEASRLLDMEQIVAMAVSRVEESGIVFLDEIDKVAGRESAGGARDVSREGVQRDLLPIVEGTSVSTRHGVVKTDHILFIAAGAFHVSKPSDLIPELQGRFPIRVELESLTQEDFERILTEPKHSLTCQYVALMRTEGVQVEITANAIKEIACAACSLNDTLEDIGARRLHTIMEKVFEQLSFEAPERRGAQVLVDEHDVRERLEGILGDEDMSRYIL